MSEFPPLDARIFSTELDEVSTAAANRLEREPSDKGTEDANTKFVLRCLVLVATADFRTIRYLCRDLPASDRPKVDYALSAPPLVRSLLDALFATVFLLDDPKDRAEWFIKSGWREQLEELSRLQKTYGGDARWDEFIAQKKNLVAHHETLVTLSPGEKANPRKQLPYWPIPNQMIKHQQLSPDRRAFLQYLEDWFYRELSQESHLSWPGLTNRAAYFVLTRTNDVYERAQKEKSDISFTALIIFLSLLSEIEMSLGYRLREKLQFVWTSILDHSLPGKEIYDQRYRAGLAP